MRLGFSGTPTDLNPRDLGVCHYEKGSDGQMVAVLTSPKIVQFQVKHNWTVQSLLMDIAKAEPSFHSLIDTGALIIGMSNLEVAVFLLANGLSGNNSCCYFVQSSCDLRSLKPCCIVSLVDMEGVVYLDSNDQQ